VICSLYCADWPLELSVFELVPSTSQVVFEGDRFSFKCHVAESETEMNVTWMHNGDVVRIDDDHGLTLSTDQLPDRTRTTTLIIQHLNAATDTGNWTCRVETALGASELSVEIVVLSRKTVYCPMEVTNSNRGQYIWPSTIAGMEQTIPCIASSAPGFDASDVGVARRTCDVSGHWTNADVSQCRYVSKTTQALEDYLLVRMHNTVDIIPNSRVRSHSCYCWILV